MQSATPRILMVVLACLAAETQTYTIQGWPVQMPIYSEEPREYADEDYYDTPKQQYYYQAPVVPSSEVYGHMPYPYVSSPYGQIMKMPEGHEERLQNLPIGQEVWFENPAQSRENKNHNVNAAFLNNLILNEMAQDAERKREKDNYAFQPDEYETSETERDLEDEDVRELKALSGKPFYHVPKTVPRFEEEDDEEYPSDEAEADSFINWNGNKRSVKINTTPSPTTVKPAINAGQKEVILSSPGQTQKSRLSSLHQHKSDQAFYNTVAQLMANKAKNTEQDQPKERRIDKRFVSGDDDLVYELRGLKHRIRT